ncbi:MAG TPA: hypothetical protein VKZ45_02565 [Vicingaceae bacterium]|nr:hypothetical protein [Vicingaceae bacterium]
MLFQERAKIAKKALEKEEGFTYEEMLAIQKKWKGKSKVKNKKKAK